MDEEERAAFDGKPLFDVVQAVSVNLFLLGLYCLLLLWSLVSGVLIVVFANVSWPLAVAMACAVTVLLLHFGILATGLILVPGFEPYPVAPKGLYRFVDFGLGVSTVLVVISYSLNPKSSTIPLIGNFWISVCLALAVQKVLIVARGVLSNERDRATGAPI
jgi:hypothetical protein